MSSVSSIEVHKFGGASIKDAAGFRNVAQVIKGIQQGAEGANLLIIVSALGKTTNALEKLTAAFYTRQVEQTRELMTQIRKQHTDLLNELFLTKDHAVYDDISNCFTEIEWVIEDDPHDSYDFVYDQIVSVGELLSSRMLSAWLNESAVENEWADARDYLIADNTYREGLVDMDRSCGNIRNALLPLVRQSVVVCQGFIGGTTENYTITLGREGSDYSAAIFAHCLDAVSLTVWKDVPGIMNADPAEFPEAVVLPQLSYAETTELAYYGATVIHPKTLKPLQSKAIPLFVKSFKNLTAPGTLVSEIAGLPEFPSYIFKREQLILTLQTPDFSFILENHLSHIFQIFAHNRIKINMMENSALSFTAVIDGNRNEANFSRLLDDLSLTFSVKYNTGLTLLTVRNYLKDPQTAYKFILDQEVILESKTRHNIQFVYR